tara:strand:+ start:3972 stop:4139 length:168 start_codon:yes stop_codon:yes gene_type:complete
MSLLMLTLTGCASTLKDFKEYEDGLDTKYRCRGLELPGGTALCVNDVSLTVTVVF